MDRIGEVQMKEKIIALITEILQVPGGTVTETTLIEDLEEWDSLAQVLIVGELESQLGIVIPLDEAVEITGVADILAKAGL
ncbi:MAG: acyl carrier protein [Acetatifactor sp.]|nr:acyl carrier protein [Acetatifactor sp.]